jgi:hypothetical protein
VSPDFEQEAGQSVDSADRFSIASSSATSEFT